MKWIRKLTGGMCDIHQQAIQMRPSSAKKKRIESALTQQIQSKLLITSRQINTTASNVLSKYDRIRHEEQLNKEYNLKFLSDRKRNSSSKVLPASNSKQKQAKKERPALTPKKLNFEADGYRDKYVQLHDTYLEEKRKWLGEQQKSRDLKQCVYDFLKIPQLRQGEELGRALGIDKAKKLIRKVVERVRKTESWEHILDEVMDVLKVDSVEQIAPALRIRLERFKNLDECTFRILELESINKKIVSDFEDKLRVIREQNSNQGNYELECLREEQEMTINTLHNIEDELRKQRQQNLNITADLSRLTGQNIEESIQWSSSCMKIPEIHRAILELQRHLKDIEIEAEENMFKIMTSNKEIVRLESLMGELKEDLEKQIEDQEQTNQENLCEINHLNEQIAQLQLQIEHHQEEVKQGQAELEREKAKHLDEYELMANTLDIKEVHPAKIVLKIQETVKQLQLANSQAVRVQSEIQEKDTLLVSLRNEIMAARKSESQTRADSADALSQKEEYKFLLNNLRDQVTLMKRQHQEEKEQMVRRKEKEIIDSHQDILEGHAHLNEQYSALRNEFGKMRIEFEENKADLAYATKKVTHQEKIIAEREHEHSKMAEENQRYRNYIKEIESSFKEVVDLEEQSSRKVRELEYEVAEKSAKLEGVAAENKGLETLNMELTETRNQAKGQLQTYARDVKDLREERVRLESTIVELRLQLITGQNEYNKLEEENIKSLKQIKSYKTNNEKLSTQVNQVTKKLLISKMEMKKRVELKLRGCFESVLKVEKEQRALSNQVSTELSELYLMLQNNMVALLQKALAERETSNIRDISSVQSENIPSQFTILREQESVQCQAETADCGTQYDQEEEEISKHSVDRVSVGVGNSEEVSRVEFSVGITEEDLQREFKVEASDRVRRTHTEPCGVVESELSEKSMYDVSINCLLSQQSLRQARENLKNIAQEVLNLKKIKTQILNEIKIMQQDHKDKIINLLDDLEEKEYERPEVEPSSPAPKTESLDQIVNALEHGIIYEVDEQLYSTQRQQTISPQQPPIQRINQGQAVNNILIKLLDQDGQVPSVSYWSLIEPNFLAIRKKITKRPAQLKLDISAIDSRDGVHSSPMSNCFPETDFFRRSVTESDDVGDRDIREIKDTYRSEKQSFLGDTIRRQNEDLREKVQLLTEDQKNTVMINANLESRVAELQMELQELNIKVVSLENETSIKGIENNFKKLLEYVLSENGELFEQCCRVLMKMVHFEAKDIKDYEERLSAKRRKKKTGLFGGLFV